MKIFALVIILGSFISVFSQNQAKQPKKEATKATKVEAKPVIKPVPSYETKLATAEVMIKEGLYIFVESLPVRDYDYLGTVESTITLGDTQFSGCRDRLIKKCKKAYPQANGLIITFNSGGTDRADAIILK